MLRNHLHIYTNLDWMWTQFRWLWRLVFPVQTDDWSGHARPHSRIVIAFIYILFSLPGGVKWLLWHSYAVKAQQINFVGCRGSPSIWSWLGGITLAVLCIVTSPLNTRRANIPPEPTWEKIIALRLHFLYPENIRCTKQTSRGCCCLIMRSEKKELLRKSYNKKTVVFLLCFALVFSC